MDPEGIIHFITSGEAKDALVHLGPLALPVVHGGGRISHGVSIGVDDLS